MSMGISLSGDERAFLREAASLSIDGYNATPDPSPVILLTNAVYESLGWPWNSATAKTITGELERKGLLVFVRRTSAAGKFHVTDKGLQVAGHNSGR